MKIPDNVKAALNAALKSRRIVVGTASKACVPNAVPMANIRFLDDETIIVIDNYLLKTRKNLEENPQLTLSFWDMEEKEGKLATKEGYQIKGKAKIETSGQLYEKTRAEIKAMNPNLSAKAIVLVKVEEIYDIKPGANAGKRIL
ncbi:MAG: pyridoxamine 5'-phosphate oxidase family protein [Candidatus Methanomethyliaceae archaeon]|nr:pyridoxamine 5'-phosphate oxidase family protein [Candidatus Methanomethyliaceae archaeon]